MDTRTDDLLLVTTPTVPGRQIDDYLGLVSGEARVRISAAAARRRGTLRPTRRSSLPFEQRLSRARSRAIAEMIQAATDIGATAIIAITIDYVTMNMSEGSNTLIICATGTAVELS